MIKDCEAIICLTKTETQYNIVRVYKNQGRKYDQPYTFPWSQWLAKNAIRNLATTKHPLGINMI